MSRLLITVAAATGLVACAPSSPRLPPAPSRPASQPAPEVEDWEDWGPEKNAAARAAEIPGDRLSGDAIRETFAGETLRGCYPDGTRFAERLATDGNFYDAAADNQLLGQWGIRNDTLCFAYPETGQTPARTVCFAVFRNGAAYDFWTDDLTREVASTTCG